jgi:putative aldouronate transport system substrate-binding protein
MAYRLSRRTGKGYRDRVIMPLNDVIAESAPNFSKWLQDHDKIRKEVSTDSGKFYLFPVCREVDGSVLLGLPDEKDWLEKVGMQAPTTMDEWYTVLKAFKDQNVNGQGMSFRW